MGKKASFQKVEQQQQKRSFCPFFFRPPKSCSKKKRVDTRSQKDEKRRRTTTPGGCLDATLKKRTDRRNRRHDFPELKFVQDGGFTGGIETNLRAFSARDKKNESLRSVHNKREIPRNRPAYANAFHPFKTTDATPRRGEAADVPPHRISQNPKKKSPLPFRPVGALRPPLFARRAIQNPIRSLIIIIENAGLFDLTTRVIPSKKRARSLPTREDTTLKPHI